VWYDGNAGTVLAYCTEQRCWPAEKEKYGFCFYVGELKHVKIMKKYEKNYEQQNKKFSFANGGIIQHIGV
jgi:hypothetical protein